MNTFSEEFPVIFGLPESFSVEFCLQKTPVLFAVMEPPVTVTLPPLSNRTAVLFPEISPPVMVTLPPFLKCTA